MTEQYVVDLFEVDRTQVDLVGGKAASLGELARLDGVRVPAGFCVTTDAFRQALAQVPTLDELLDHLDRLSRSAPEDREAIGALGAQLRRAVEGIAVSDDLATAVTEALTRLGEQTPCAVRSSATAEDSPTASFAGQQDTYLNVVGPEAVLRNVVRCWASLYTERAVIYRGRHGIDHRRARMAVVVQKMVSPRSAGVMFTADPVGGHRRVAVVEAGFGLGDALVSGQVTPDVFAVRGGEIIRRTVAADQVAGHVSPEDGTRVVPVDPQRQNQPALTDPQVLRLVELGRRIEAHLGSPQDIEWCLADDDVHVVQSRPITTLFPVPVPVPVPGLGDGEQGSRVYVSVGHGQMMTDAMKPLGLSVWQLTALVPMVEAGGRLFVDVTARLASPAIRPGLLELLGRGDPLVRDALETVLDRGDIVPTLPAPAPALVPAPGSGSGSSAGHTPPSPGGVPAPIEADPAVVTELVERSEASLAALRRDIATRTGPELFDVLLEGFGEQKRLLGDPLSMKVIMAGMEATWWLNDRLGEWLGERNAADTLTLSAPGNVTSEMGLALLDVADVIRRYPQVVAFLREVRDVAAAQQVQDGLDPRDGQDPRGEGFLDELERFPGGTEARDAVHAWLDRYGMRCVGEIDITRPRWGERPSTLVPLILDNLRLFEPGESRRRFERGRQLAQRKAEEVLARLRALPDGDEKADETQRMIDRVRTFIGYREYPKYAIVGRLFVYRQAMLAEADRLVRAGVLREREDVFFLTFAEFHDVVRTHQVDDQLVRQRRDAFRSFRSLTPPRVLTSDGECFSGAYRRQDVPAGALVGLPVSVGTVEGRARVIREMAQADLVAGDILVTVHTDPSWSPLFVAAAGLVTEVGGLMTHGAVIAREYGLPAVVGVDRATRLIRDGQRIRVHGTDGYVELLP